MDVVKKILKPISSLRLTVVLLALAMLVVYAGTLAQRSAGIETVKKLYFHTWFTWVAFQDLVPFHQLTIPRFLPKSFPMLGGWTLVVLMLVNLISAHALRFKPSWRDLMLIPPLAGSLWLLWSWQDSHSTTLLVASITVAIVFLGALVALHKKRAGVIVLHLGLIFLLLGELVTSVFQQESQMTIEEGSYATYSQDIRHAELAFTDRAPSDRDNVLVVPGSQLSKVGKTVADRKLPFELKVDAWYPNSNVERLAPGSVVPENTPTATAGAGLTNFARNERAVAGVADEAQKVDAPSGYVTLRTPGGQPIGTYLVSLHLKPQDVTIDGRTYAMELRFRRDYKPFKIALKDFSFKRYDGTEMAKDYASVVQLTDPANNVDREVRIWMNHPLRYNGETYYQSSFTPDEKATVLQVVRNPGWLMPYFSCAIISLGLVGHFLLMLITFLMRQFGNAPRAGIARPGDVTPPPIPGKRKGSKKDAGRNGGGRDATYTLEPRPLVMRWSLLACVVTVVLTLAMFGLFARTPKYIAANSGQAGKFDFDAFSRLPISHGGRPMPMESQARDILKISAERESFYIHKKPWPTDADERKRFERSSADEEARPQVEFLLDFMTRADRRDQYEVFRITNQELLGFLNLDERQKRYSIAQIMTRGDELQRQIHQAAQKKGAKQALSQYETDLLELAQHVGDVRTMEALPNLIVIPPPPESGKWDERWRSISQLAQDARSRGEDPREAVARDPYAEAFVGIIQAYTDNDPAAFNRAVAEYGNALEKQWPSHAPKLDLEVGFRRFDPFHKLRYVYALVFLLAALSWIGWNAPLRNGALAMLAVLFLAHTAALGARFVITGRPPVTTLYTSAVFIGWGAILTAIFVEFVTRKGIGTAAAAVIGFVTLLIAHYLYMAERDSMPQLQAVLDTNLWLWVHVQTVTFGYAATFLAGLFGIGFVLAGVLSKGFDAETRKMLGKAVYGVVCFATLLSFIGTTTGGIWADQSWGRFWGWDPKENGAILIVLWNAIILHSRWAGLVRERGIATMAIAGGIVTSWSWFGTNMLGVGLHAYGFMNAAVTWLGIADAVLISFIIVGCLPIRMWRSYATA